MTRPRSSEQCDAPIGPWPNLGCCSQWSELNDLHVRADRRFERFCGRTEVRLASARKGFVRGADVTTSIDLPPPSWTRPAKTIAIATLERSGSNFLCEMMRQTECLGRPAEYFSPPVLAQKYPGKIVTPTESCHLAMEEGVSENGVAAIKLFPEHFAALQRQIRLSDWFGRPHWIWLRRRDILGQAISFEIALQRKSFSSLRPAKKEAVYSTRRISTLLGRLVQRDTRWALFFARNGIVPLRVDYESVELDPLASVREIGEFCDISLGDVQLRPGEEYGRQRNSLNADWREQFVREVGNPDILIDASSQRRSFKVKLKGWLSRLAN